MDNLLHAITNRSSFASPVFSQVSDFQPVKDPVGDRVRAALCLDYTDHDYYVAAVLTAVQAFPDLRDSFGDPEVVSAVEAWRRPADEIIGGALVPGLHGPPALRRMAGEFPVVFQIGLSWFSPQDLRIQVGADVLITPARFANGIIYPDWPESTGISGGLRLAQPWGAGWSAVIKHVPVNYPWAAAAAAVAAVASTDLDAVLRAAGLLDHFFHARSALEKIAVVALALGGRRER